MRREDWLWLLLKAAGLWLVVTAVEVMSVESWSWFQSGEHDTAGREQFLRVVVPLGVGLCLLLVDFARWLPVEAKEPAPEPDQGSVMLRSDWLWVGLKVVGAYYAMAMIVYVSVAGVGSADGLVDWLVTMAGSLVSFALCLWLLFGDRVWRVASRDSEQRESATSAPRRRGGQVRDVAVVVFVFALLGSIPILLLVWVGGG